MPPNHEQFIVQGRENFNEQLLDNMAATRTDTGVVGYHIRTRTVRQYVGQETRNSIECHSNIFGQPVPVLATRNYDIYRDVQVEDKTPVYNMQEVLNLLLRGEKVVDRDGNRIQIDSNILNSVQSSVQSLARDQAMRNETDRLNAAMGLRQVGNHNGGNGRSNTVWEDLF